MVRKRAIQRTEKQNDAIQSRKTEAKESVVRVYFPARGFACSYYNDKFDLKKGDGVYVDGKLEGLLGFITEVSYCFKIRLSEYKRVIYRVDTEIRGKLYLLGDFFAAFDEDVIPKEKYYRGLSVPTSKMTLHALTVKEPKPSFQIRNLLVTSCRSASAM